MDLKNNFNFQVVQMTFYLFIYYILDIYFSQFWRLENQKIKALADSIWQGPSSWYINGIFLRCPHIAEEVRDLFEVSKDTNPIHEGSILMS